MQNYNQIQELETKVNGATVRFFSKPGLFSWQSVPPSASLIVEQTALAPTDRLYYLGCGHGAAAVPIAWQLQQGELWLHDPSVIALQCAHLTLQENQVHNAKISHLITLVPEQSGNFDSVLIDLPKGRKLGRRWLVESHLLLKPGGKLFLAGSNEMGVQSLIKDGQALFGNVGILGYKKGNRLAYFVKMAQEMHPRPDWVGEAGIAPGTWSSYSLEIEGERMLVHSLPGVFSQDNLDEGTRLLLQHAPAPKGNRILDLGCGSGVIGMVLARRFQRTGQTPDIRMLDSNLYAVASAEFNIQMNHLPGIQAAASDLIEAAQDEVFDQILSNPPFHAGNEINYAISEAMIHQSHAALASGGELILVANRFIRYDLPMQKIFNNVRGVHQDSKFHILAATKS